MCQEYQQRGGGMPDLFLWDFERKECMFAEGIPNMFCTF